MRYSYDGSGRLSTVTLDLSPDDNSVSDGKVFTSTYAYDGSSARIASITQSDGAKVAFTYQLVGSDYRVASIAQTSDTGVLRTTTLSYDVANRRTTITDPLGQDTILSYDDQGRLLQTSSPAVAGVRQIQVFTYNADGQVATIRDGLNNEVKYTYDAAGNLIKQEDAVGTIVERTFGSDNQLLSETVSGPNTVTATTRYVYDAEQHLRFKISAEGRVTELRYNAAGQQTGLLTYSEGKYTGATFTEAALASWAGANSRIGERTDTAYDFRGNVSSVTRYGTLAADGSGVIDDKTIQSRFVYDEQGRLLQHYAGPIGNPDVEQFTYDGLGRVLSATAFNDSITLTQYDDAQRRTIVSFSNGLVRTSTYNHAGELIALAESGGGGTVLSQVRYHYDADGRLRMTEDALGAKTHVLYDEAGRRAGEIDSAGALTEYLYDANNQVIKTTRYSNAATAAAMAALVDANGKPKQTTTVNGQAVMLTLANSGLKPAVDSVNDREEWRFYDSAGRLYKTVGADGALTEYTYDAASRLVRSRVYDIRVNMTTFRANPTVANAVSAFPSTPTDLITRYYYSADGLLIGVMDGTGGVTETLYDGAGRKVKTIAYWQFANQNLFDTGTLDQLRPTATAQDIHTYFNYDSRGLLVSQIDGERYLTRYEYDAQGHVTQRIRGEQVSEASLKGTHTLNGSFNARMETFGGFPQVKVWVDNALAATVTLDSITYKTYNFSANAARGKNHDVRLEFLVATGSSIWINAAEFSGVSFDAGGHSNWTSPGSSTVQQYPSGEVAAYGDLLAVWSAPDPQNDWPVFPDSLDVTLPGVLEKTSFTYDTDGRLLSKTEFSSSGNVESRYAYDNMGNLIAENRADRKTQYRFDLQGRLTAQLSGEGVKALQALGANPTQSAVDAIWADWGVRYQYDAAGHRTAMIDALDRSTLFYYDAQGRLTHTVSAAGEVTEQRYNIFGEVSQSVVYGLRLTSLSLGQMHGGQMSQSERDAIAALDNDKASRTTLSYAVTGLLSRTIDALGAYTDRTYTTFGAIDKVTRWSDFGRSQSKLIEIDHNYDRAGREVNVIEDSAGSGSQLKLRTTNNYDAFGRVVTRYVQGADGALKNVVSKSYDRRGQVLIVKDRDSDASNYFLSYDAFGNVLKRGEYTSPGVQTFTTYSYTAFNREIQVSTAEGVLTKTRYNEHGQVVELIDGRGNSTTYEYDLDGRLIRSTNPAGTVSSHYDQAGQVIETTDARGVKSSFEYDAVGRVLTRTLDPTGLAIKTKYEYDAKGQLVRVTDPLGTVSETRYDLNGQKVAVVVDAGDGRLNLTTTFEYDALGQTVQATEGVGTAAAVVTRYEYDKGGRRIATIVDPNGLALTTRYTYDAVDMVVASTDANGQVTRFVYDRNSELLLTIDATGAVQRRDIDRVWGRFLGVTQFAKPIDLTGLGLKVTLAEIQARLQPQTGVDRTTQQILDTDGRLRYAIDSQGYVTELVYDASNNVVRTIAYAVAIPTWTNITAQTVTALLSEQTSAMHAQDRQTQTIYDAAGRAVFQIDAARFITRNQYDANGNLIARARFAAAYPIASATTLQALDTWAAGQPTNAAAEEHWAYDAAGRVAWQVNAGNTVTRYTYDAAGNRRMSVSFLQLASGPQRPSAYTMQGMAAWYTQFVGNDARSVNPTTMWFYDTAGRSVFSYDAEGYFTETGYDAADHATSSSRYDRKWGALGADRAITLNDNAASLRALLTAAGSTNQTTQYRYDAAGRLSDTVDALGGMRHYQRDGLGQVIAEFAAWGTAEQTVTRRSYDAGGRVVEETSAADTAAVSRKRFVYNAFGQVVASIDPRGVELAESDSAWALEQRFSLGYKNETGAALRAADLNAAQKAALLALYTSRSSYDINGRLVESIDPQGGTIRRDYNGFGEAFQIIDAMGRAGFFFYDALGRVTYQVDPEGYLTRTEYDFQGNASKIHRYYERIDYNFPTGGVPATPAGAVATTQMEYDLLGRLVKVTDAQSGVEAYGYDAFGNRTQLTNKLGGTTYYGYDKLGRMLSERLPVTAAARAGGAPVSVTNYFQYDAHGNLIRQDDSGDSADSRVTLFAYDALNRKISSTAVVATGQGDVNAVEKAKYDARGNLIEKIGANNARTVFYYDANNRQVGQVDSNGLLALNEFDAAGNLVRTRAFEKAVALPAGWALPAEWINPTTGKPDQVRETRFVYDANGRRIESQVIGVAHGAYGPDPDHPEKQRYIVNGTDIVERWSYDLGGRLVEYSDGNGNITQTYYNALGQKRLEIDGEGYAIKWDRDAEGNVLTETRYSQRRPPPALARQAAFASDEPVEQIISNWPVDEENDRVTVYTYDKMGRRLSESRLNVDYGVVDTGTGALTQIDNGTATTAYAYDAAGNLLRRTDANGSVFGWEYDKIGRNTAAILPGFVDYAGRFVAARTEYGYNGLNQVLKETRRGAGNDLDQVTSYVYGAGGRLLSKTNALNYTTRFGYDVVGNMVSMSYLRTDSAGGQRTETVQLSFDENNREISRVTVGSDGTRSVERRTRYNVFGDVTGRGLGALQGDPKKDWQEFAEYDYAGRVLKSNMEGGITKVYVYDGAGNTALQIQSQSEDLSDAAWTLDKILDPPLEKQGAFASTLSLYDKRNKLIDVVQASMTTAGERLGLKTTAILPIRPGEIQSTVGGRLGNGVRDPQHHGEIDGLPSVAPTNATSVPPVTGDHIYRAWPGGGDHDPPTSMAYLLQIPDYSNAFGSEYEIRIAIEGQQVGPISGRWEDMNKPVPVYPLLGQFVGDRNNRSALVQVPVFLRNVDASIRNASISLTVKVFVTPRGSGGGREILVGTSNQANAEIKWDEGWDYDSRVDVMSGSLATTVNSSLPPEFSGHVIQMPIDAYDPGNSPQVYVRRKDTNGPYQSLPVERGFEQGKATVDISGLDGAYELLYVSTNSSGALVRREKYTLVVGPNQSIERAPDTTDGAFQANGVGTFVWNGNGLDMTDLLTRKSAVPANVVVEYRRKGSQDPWIGTAALGRLPPLGTKGSARWDTSGLSGDYEVVLKMLDAQGKELEAIRGEVTVGGAPNVALDFPRDDENVIRLSNLPPNAASMNLQLLRSDGTVAASASGLSIANGALSPAWAIPPEVLAEVGNGVIEYKLVATLIDNRVVPPSNYTATGKVEIGPQRTQASVIKVDHHLYTVNLDPKSAEGQVLVLHYRPEGNSETLFKQVIILRGADGKYRWDSLDLDKQATYEYFYDVFRTLTEAQNPGTGERLVRNNGYFWADNDRPAIEASWEITNFEPSALTIHRQQSYNAFGEIESEADGNAVAKTEVGSPVIPTTRLFYNTLGKLVRKEDAEVTVTLGNGFEMTTRPVTRYVYDRVGSIVAYYDANGNRTTQAWNYGSAQPTLLAEWHADDGVKRFQLDVFGNQRVVTDELGRRTGYGYDLDNRLISIERPQGPNDELIVDSYAYDELNHRIRHTSSLLGADTTDFSIEGEVSKVTSAQGRVTLYTATWDAQANGGFGAWRRVTTTAVGKPMTDLVDALGRKLSHVDMGGNTFGYEYNFAGLLKTSGTTSYEYYKNGLIKRMTDTVTGIKGDYEYDNNGNRTFEGFTTRDGNWAFQQSRGEYDAMNRLIRVFDPRYEITYGYDAQGNRIHMKSMYKDGLNGATRIQDYWYRYDNMNRFTITMGQLQLDAGVEKATSADDTRARIVVGNEDGVELGYDAANQRRMAKYGRDSHTERYEYDQRGYLTDTRINDVLRARRVNDLAGRVIDYIEYDANGAARSHISHVWDNDSLLMQDHDNINNKGTVTFRMADGTVEHTETYGEETTLTTTYSYLWFDSAKQSQIRVQANNEAHDDWAPGFSDYLYDKQGRILQAYDSSGHRAFSYQVDGEGRILQRNELLGGTKDTQGMIVNAEQNRHHSYYFFDDKQIGNVGDDGIDRIDYAKELAQNEAQAGAKNDERHKRFTPVAGANFDENYQPINSLYPTAAPGSYIVKAGDTLQGIAAALWGDSAMWYLLADANGLAPNQPLIANTVLTVPNKVTNIHNNASTFKPYDAGSAMGNTTPTVPEPPPPPSQGKGCGGFVKVLAIVVAVVATIFTAGAATIGFGAGFSAIMGAGTATLAGAGGFALAVGAGALGGAVGSIASQAVLIAGGVQDKFDWKGVALGAVGSAVTAGLASSTGISNLLSNVPTKFGQAAARSALNSTVTQGIAVSTGLQDSFDWKSVAISAASGAVGYGVAQGIGRMQYGVQGWSDISNKTILGDVWKTGTRNFVTGLAAGAVSAAARGKLSGDILMSVGLDALGSTIGNSISDHAANTNNADAAETLSPFASGTVAEEGLGTSNVWGRHFWDEGNVSLPGAGAVSSGRAVRIAGSGAPFTSGNFGDVSRTFPSLIVTPDPQFTSDYMQVWEWATRYNRPAPPRTTSQVELNNYRSQQYKATAPAYYNWLASTYGGPRGIGGMQPHQSFEQNWQSQYEAPIWLKRGGGALIGAIENGLGMTKDTVVGTYHLAAAGLSMAADGFGETLARVGVDTEFMRSAVQANQARRSALVGLVKTASTYQAAWEGNLLYTVGVETPYTAAAHDFVGQKAGEVWNALAEPFELANQYEDAGDPISAARLRGGAIFKYGMTAVTALRGLASSASDLGKLGRLTSVDRTISTAHASAEAGEEMVYVYRGTNRGTENAIFEETGHLLSDSAQRGYVESGGLDDAYRASNATHKQWVEIWGDEGQYVEAHSAFGTELKPAFGLDRTFISVTTDPAVAARFSRGGVTYGGYVPRSSLLEQTLRGATESEYLVRNGTNLLKPIMPPPIH
ncbi:LysM peptidoglycan-binding domain-containing protein [Lysobacter sp. ISL-42]|uniref:LysM peptidoglycan-binding domain-containing protein n=1 Tax=Lysobacter sp. ISL-42 TaxID=2819152 RepID=UPI0031F2E6A9